MRILAFRHVPFIGLGLIEASLSARGIGVHYASLYESGNVPDIADYDGLISLGGPMSVNDDLPYLRQEMGLMREAISRRQPVLGICLGAQLIASALGAAVRRNPAKEIGWFPLHFTGAASGDPLFHGLAQRETVFHWHGDTFDLPDGAECWPPPAFAATRHFASAPKCMVSSFISKSAASPPCHTI